MNAAHDALTRAEIGVIGGTGLYALLSDATEVTVSTPYGDPADTVTVGTVGGRRVAFLPRHGRDHSLPPHRINYRANIWALRSLGVGQIIAPCAVGSLRRELGPGTVVVPDQVVDRTAGRPATFFDDVVSHASFADPYCAAGRTAVLKAGADNGGGPLVDGGAMVVIEGPRFSSRAESQWYAAQGWSLVNMTGMPEASLAREMALCYTSVALVTDLDAGLDAEESVAQEDVYEVFSRNLGRLRDLVLATVTRLPEDRVCRCARALDGVDAPFLAG